ncbi:MAG: pyruvate kinase [Anaerolineae bacterium]|nr:pyruvate kinase [Anaerolineae bacterium]MEB2286902.1 pyruvate kinase [Anaerolineae bacterium]
MEPMAQYRKRTKIVATIGPASQDIGMLRAMVRAGMDVARINFSHGDHESHARNIENLRRVAEEEGKVLAILADIPGPKLRLGTLVQDPLELTAGDLVTLTASTTLDPEKPFIVPLPHQAVLDDLNVGERLLLDDGQLEFVVAARQGADVRCEVLLGGLLSSHKGVSVPDSALRISPITDEDREHIRFALEQDVDYLAMSFVRTADDLRELRWLVRHLKGEVALIAKIEKAEAITNFDAILAQSDGIMVARGDLGVETPAERVPVHQKNIIKRCNEVGKPVITATQMLQSMIDNPRPTRAESTDVANAIFDGTDAVMLSGETAVGKYPLQAVEMMVRIARIAEQYLDEHGELHRAELHLDTPQLDRQRAIAATISHMTSRIADMLDVKLIVASTWSGYTAQRVARVRPKTPILAATPNTRTFRRLALVWGVLPILVNEFATIDEMIDVVVETACRAQLVALGDLIVIIGGVPFGIGSQTNFLKVLTVGENGSPC